MDLHFSGKRALITGSSSVIGAEIARMLAAEGTKVVVHGRDQTRTQAVANEVEMLGGQAATALGDLSTEAGISGVIEASQQAFGGIDILMNNVGGSVSVAQASGFDAPVQEWAGNYA